MTTPIIFPDVELWAAGYLRTALTAHGYPDVYVSNRREAQSTAVWVRRDGGTRLDVIREAPRLTVNVFAAGPTDEPVSALARTVAALMCAAADGTPVVKVTQISGPSPVADNLPRRVMAFELIVRGAELSPS